MKYLSYGEECFETIEDLLAFCDKVDIEISLNSLLNLAIEFIYNFIEDVVVDRVAAKENYDEEYVYGLMECYDFLYEDCVNVVVNHYDLEKSYQDETRIFKHPNGKLYAINVTNTPYEGIIDVELFDFYEVEEIKVEKTDYRRIK
jgi:hypothetical protein